MGHANATVDRVGLRAVAYHHGASATVATGTTLFDIGGLQFFAQNVEQGAMWRHIRD
jgi:hypothetical protein